MGEGTGTFDVRLSGLNLGTTYYIRAFAASDKGNVERVPAFNNRNGLSVRCIKVVH